MLVAFLHSFSGLSMPYRCRLGHFFVAFCFCFSNSVLLLIQVPNTGRSDGRPVGECSHCFHIKIYRFFLQYIIIFYIHIACSFITWQTWHLNVWVCCDLVVRAFHYTSFMYAHQIFT